MGGGLHHVELWVPSLTRAVAEWGWLLGELGWVPFQEWGDGCSWQFGDTYLVVEQSPVLTGGHDRLCAGLNHLALHARDRAAVDALAERAPAKGWRPMFADRYPRAGGEHHYAAYLENGDGFEVEVVAP